MMPTGFEHDGGVQGWRRYALLAGWAVLGVAAELVDHVTGPLYSFPVLYLLPIGLAAWYNGRWPGVVIGVLMLGGEIAFDSARFPAGHGWHILGYCAARLLMLGALVFLIDLVARQRREIRVLHGLLPICSFCKKIRDESGKWNVMESYISEHSEANFTHGLCPACVKEHYGLESPPGNGHD